MNRDIKSVYRVNIIKDNGINNLGYCEGYFKRLNEVNWCDRHITFFPGQGNNNPNAFAAVYILAAERMLKHLFLTENNHGIS